MKTCSNPVIFLGVPAMFGLALTCDASAAPLHEDRRTSDQIEACVAEIGEHADYSDAARVVHVVSKLRQRNYEELEIKVDTSVFVGGDRVETYVASCVTETRGDLVRFRISPARD